MNRTTAPPFLPTRDEASPVPLSQLDAAVGNRKLVLDCSHWFWNWR